MSPATGVRDLAAAAGAVARSLRQGDGIHQAIVGAASETTVDGNNENHVAPHHVIGPLAEGLQRGQPLATSVEEWVRSCSHATGDGIGRRPRLAVPVWRDDAELFGAALLVGARFGGDTAAALDAVASTLMQRAELVDETDALTSQARASMWTLCALPILGTALFAFVDSGVVVVLLTTAVGRVCLATGVFLELTAVVVARWMLRRALRDDGDRHPAGSLMTAAMAS